MKYNEPRKVFDRYFSVAEERALLSAIRKHSGELAMRDLYWITFGRQTGVRVSVLSGMTCDDARRALREDRFYVRHEINKGNKSYEVFLNKKARQALNSLLSIRRKMGVAEDSTAPLIVTRRGNPISVRNLQSRMAGWIKKAGLRGGSPHWLRHTLAKRIMKNSTSNDPRAIVMAALGHSDINNTVIYTWPDLEDIQTSMTEAAA